MYIPVKIKLIISIILSLLWVAISVYLALPWIADISGIFGSVLAWMIVSGIALIPGFINAFVVAALLLDKRPVYEKPENLPDICVLIAAYNEEKSIEETFESIVKQEYPGNVKVLLVDDGSTDNTVFVANLWIGNNYYPSDIQFNIIEQSENGGKSKALNTGLTHVDTEYVVAIDADTYLYKDALMNLVNNIHNGPPNTAAVAGTVLVRNSRTNILTKLQEWDFFQGISVVKRTQSLFQGTLVAQGAFSVYRTDVLQEVDGWDEMSIGEDIVLTWSFRDLGYRVGYSENAFAFTNVPETYKQFFKQRERWARGLFEAFKKHPSTIWTLKPNTPFIWVNLMFPFIDFFYLTAFIPGIIAAVFFQWYALANVITLLLLPLAILMSWLIFINQKKTFDLYGLKVRKHFLGFAFYMIVYQLVMAPATLTGYFKEILGS